MNNSLDKEFYYAERNSRFLIYFNFYFLQLKGYFEKESFLNNFHDEDIKSNLIYLKNKFLRYGFHADEILVHARTETELNIITKWQKSFYLEIFNEYHWHSSKQYMSLTNDFSNLKSNPSFQFLLNLENETFFDEVISEVSKEALEMKFQNQVLNDSEIQSILAHVLSNGLK